ncbi:hypothetical protein [Streptomyces sp. HB132]|uniref:hypothetical protein n=1 Tax=Streptomyces sp. HB132 TaxID=767388 RepID=UPI00195FEB94|nr:hypothetical protein [Streptomyces sp. HB132]MBM7441166.1 FtsH-binding integral membrane protein [Streptomyces sp. HB132]
MKVVLLLCVVFAAFALLATLVRPLGRRARIPGWNLIVFLLAGWLTVSVGLILSQRAQPTLFPDTSPCYGTRSTPVSQYFPPDSFCLHADGELRTANGPAAKFLFWTAAGTTAAMVVAGALARRRRRG